ncbi:MAG: GNAT family N-acetyltransferase [Pirellulaceae bacterium]|jgi:ribosomal protein S18 acetylase RimI-like enzyme|nr:GNAT family N-acetyltransferase [Pirellulaceae bacterium]
MTDLSSIQAATADQQLEALALLFADLPESARFQQASNAWQTLRHHPNSGALLVALDGDQVVAAVYGQLMQGGAAVIFPPRLRQDGKLAVSDEERLAISLLDQLEAELQRRDVSLLQANLPVAASEDARLLRQAGFEHQITLSYLAIERTEISPSKPICDLEFQPFQETEIGRFEAVVEATYANTFDCPELNGARRVADVVDGYRHTGVNAPDGWFFVRKGADDVGCLVLADHPALDEWELVYVGLVPTARGRGWGEQATRFACWQAFLAGRGGVVLGVDERNDPAIAIYSRVGFQVRDRRRVLLKILRNGDS